MTRLSRALITEARRLAWDSLGLSTQATIAGLAGLAVTAPLAALLARQEARP